jgi:hypothetical protein
MNTRPAWGVLLLGVVIIAVLIVSPIWLQEFSGYIEEEEEQAPFPEGFYQLPGEAQNLYQDMYQTSPQMAVDFVAARLEEPEDVEEPNLPVIDPNPVAVELLLTGTFTTLDPLRGASGAANVYRLSDGRRLIRLEGLEAIGGPDLHVLLSAYPNPTTQEQLEQAASLQIDLGPLKGTLGNQNYIPEQLFNPDDYANGSVVLYSTRYEIIFSYASLAPPEAG